MKKSRLSPRQRSYEVDLINKLSDNHQLQQARCRWQYLTDYDRRTIESQLSHRTRRRLERIG